jgi:hypothetical protein
MIHALHILKQSPQLGAIIHIAAREENSRIEPRLIACGKIVNDPNFVTIFYESIRQRRS